MTARSVGGETIGTGESLPGEPPAETFVRLFGGMLGIEGPGEWTQEGPPGRYAVVAHFDPNAARSPGASNIIFVETSPPQSLPPTGQERV